MAMKVTTMDKRHKGRYYFSFYAVPSGLSFSERTKTFIEWRDWCWESFGPGTERDFTDHRPEAVWAWHSYEGEFRLYFKSNKELNWFKLKWL